MWFDIFGYTCGMRLQANPFLPVGFVLATAAYAQSPIQTFRGGGQDSISSIAPARTMMLDPVAGSEGKAYVGGGPFSYGEPQRLELDFMQAATWNAGPDSVVTGSLNLQCTGAKTLSLFFSTIVLSGNAELSIQGEDGRSREAFNAKTKVGADGKLPSRLFNGGEVMLVFHGTATERASSSIHLESVVRGTLDLFHDGQGQRSDECLVDVACSAGDDWVDQTRSVVMFLNENGQGCTGVLLNNTSGDFTPYVHIANHCYDGNLDPDNWVFYFNYEKPDCGSGTAPMTQTITGAQSIAHDYNGDFHLLELNQSPPLSYHAYFAGWDRSKSVPTSGAFIGHPLTLEKKIALFSSVTSGYLSGFSKPMWYANIDLGGIEGGSSGSPLFNQDKRVVGHLLDGDAGCGEHRQVIGPKFSANWTGSTPSNRLKDWLDPQGTNIMVLDGAYPEIRVKVNMMLQGAYDSGTGLMRADLAASSYVPLTEPYTGLGYSHVLTGGGETTTSTVLGATGNAAIVDWVVVELRSPVSPYSVVASRSALLRRDGIVAEVDGTTNGVKFVGLPSSTYRVAVRHRNHLGIMTNTATDLLINTATIDFASTSGASLYGTAPTYVTGSVRCLWMGDVTRDGVVKYTGTANDRDAILSALGGDSNLVLIGYHVEDVNMDGQVKYKGTFNDPNSIYIALGGNPNNVIIQQLP